jgi:hypothetical protein
MIGLAGCVARMNEMRNVYRILVRKYEGKIPPRIPWLRWEDNIKMDLRDLWLEGVNWIRLGQDRDRRWTVVKAILGRAVVGYGRKAFLEPFTLPKKDAL